MVCEDMTAGVGELLVFMEFSRLQRHIQETFADDARLQEVLDVVEDVRYVHFRDFVVFRKGCVFSVEIKDASKVESVEALAAANYNRPQLTAAVVDIFVCRLHRLALDNLYAVFEPVDTITDPHKIRFRVKV